MKTKEILNKAIYKFGAQHQMTKATEECCELAAALCRYDIVTTEHRNAVETEIADVQIMLDQLKIMFPGWKKEHRFKLKRLKWMVGG